MWHGLEYSLTDVFFARIQCILFSLVLTKNNVLEKKKYVLDDKIKKKKEKEKLRRTCVNENRKLISVLEKYINMLMLNKLNSFFHQ